MTSIFPPLKDKDGKEYHWGRMIRFVVGLAIIGQALIWGPYDALLIWGVKLGVGGLLFDPALVKQGVSIWKSRNGR